VQDHESDAVSNGVTNAARTSARLFGPEGGPRVVEMTD